jgi:hypothetical protein
MSCQKTASAKHHPPKKKQEHANAKNGREAGLVEGHALTADDEVRYVWSEGRGR